MSKAANILALSEASCSDTFSLHSLSQMVSLGTVFFRPVIYCNVLIDVYLFAAVSHPKSVSDEQPGRIVSQAPASDRKLHLSAFVCFTSFSFSFFFSFCVVQFSIHTNGELSSGNCQRLASS